VCVSMDGGEGRGGLGVVAWRAPPQAHLKVGRLTRVLFLVRAKSDLDSIADSSHSGRYDSSHSTSKTTDTLGGF